MHLCAEYFFRVSVPPPPSLEELLRFYEENWISAGFESAAEEKKYQEYGREILTRFREIHSADFHMPLAVEKMFYIDIRGVKLRGYIDRVDKLASGRLAIVDYKTNKDLFTSDYLRKDLQLTLYQLAAEQMWQLPVERLTLYHLRSNTSCDCAPREITQLEEARQLVVSVAENITSQNFPAQERDSCPCDFPEFCPHYRHLYQPPPRQELLPGLAATEAVEEYARLQAEIKERETRLGELREVLAGFCESEGLSRVFGTQHCIDYRLVERLGFDEKTARELLEPSGLWERVLRPDQSLLRELLENEEVDEEVRKSLEALRQVLSRYPQLRVKKRKEEDSPES